MTDYGIVFVTAPSSAEAEKIAAALLDLKLAACVSITPITSIYRWQGEIHRDNEWQLIIKTNLTDFLRLSQTIQDLHSYEVPEILALPIVEGLPAYLRWMSDNLS